MTNPFIDVSTWAHDYLIETRVAMVSLWHQKATPVLHDVVAYVDANRMEVSLAVFLAAFVFLSCVLAFKWLKIRKELSSVEETVSLHKSDATFWHGCWNRVRDQKWAMHGQLVSTQDDLRAAEMSNSILQDQADTLTILLSKVQEELEESKEEVSRLERDVEERDDEIAEKSSMIAEHEESIESLEDDLDTYRDLVTHWRTRFEGVDAANDELLGKVENLTQVVLRAA